MPTPMEQLAERLGLEEAILVALCGNSEAHSRTPHSIVAFAQEIASEFLKSAAKREQAILEGL